MARKPAVKPAAAPAPVVVGVIAGLASELHALSTHDSPGLAAHASAADPARAARQTEDLLARGAKGIISFGIAGALSPDVRPGDLVLAYWVRDHETGAVHACDGAWRVRLRVALARRRFKRRLWEGGIMGAGAVTGAPAVKALLHNVSGGALAVDMESAAAARVCAKAGVPFAAVRAISDPRARNVPAWLVGCIDDAGAPVRRRVWQMLKKNRRDLPAVMWAAADSARAHKALREAAKLMGPTLCWKNPAKPRPKPAPQSAPAPQSVAQSVAKPAPKPAPQSAPKPKPAPKSKPKPAKNAQNPKGGAGGKKAPKPT